MLTARDILWCALIGVSIGIATLAVQRFLTTPPPLPEPDPAAHEIWRVLDEARRITVQAAREQGL